MIVPTIAEFEQTLYEISVEANTAVEQAYNDAISKGYVDEKGEMKDSCSVGSCVMHLDRRKPLYKFLNSIPYDPEKFYFVSIYDGSVSICLRSIRSGQSYTLNRAAYDVVVENLRTKYGWEIYNNVRLD